MGRRRETGKWLKRTLEKSGPMYVKIGQFIGNRPDLFGDEISEEVSALQNHVEPFKITEKPKGLDMEDEPFASASIAQVHMGRLKNGKTIVVKMKRPNIDRELKSEMNDIKNVFTAATYLMPEMKSLLNWFDDFEKTITNELDFKKEIKNIQMFRKIYRHNPDVKIPAVVETLSTNNMIIMEYVPSKSIKSYTNPLQISENIMNMFVEQILYNGVIHGDLHAGNMGCTEDGRIVLYDFGNVIQIPEYYQNAMRRMIVAVQNKNQSELLNSMKDMKMIIHDEKAAQDFAVYFFKYIDTLDPKSFSYSSTDIKVPIELDNITLTIIRTYSLVEGLCKNVYPQFTYERIIQQNIELLMIERLVSLLT